VRFTLETAPSREIVKAYMLAQNGEGGRAMMADLERTAEAVSRDKYDKEGRIDPLKLAMAEGVREFFRRMKSIPAAAEDPEWIEIDRIRQLAEAESRLERNRT